MDCLPQANPASTPISLLPLIGQVIYGSMVQWKKYTFRLISKSPTFFESYFLIGKTGTVRTILHKIMSYVPTRISSDQLILRGKKASLRNSYMELITWKLVVRLILGS